MQEETEQTFKILTEAMLDPPLSQNKHLTKLLG